jgi:hypothetical protein
MPKRYPEEFRRKVLDLVATPTSSMLRQGLGGLISSVLYRPLIVSANALSYELPTAPTEGWIPACARRSLNRIDAY